MEVNEYQRLCARTISDIPPSDQRKHALFGMASEIGEVHGIYQKTYQGHAIDLDHVKSELGDLLWFVAEFCTAYGWTLEEVCKKNIDKLMARYPDGFDADKSLHRKCGDI